MEKPTLRSRREQLKGKRTQLFEKYSKNPMNTRLAIEIKLIEGMLALDMNSGPTRMALNPAKNRGSQIIHDQRKVTTKKR